MNKHQFWSLFCSFLIATTCYSQFPETSCYHLDAGGHERNRNIDVTHMIVNVSFIPQKNEVIGDVTHTFSSLQDNIDTIFFDAPEIQVESVWLDEKPIPFRTNPEGLIVSTSLKNDFQKTHKIRITYIAHPKRGIYFIGWNLNQIPEPAHMSRRQIWTQGQGIDNRHWIPMIDSRHDKFITETVVTFDEEYKVLSNGELFKLKTNKNKTKTWHYKMSKPHAGYLLMLAIDKYAVKQTVSKNGIPHQFWYYPEHPERVEPTSKYSEEILDFLAEEIGHPYPWGTYSQVMVQDFLYGAMENTSATVFGDFFWVDAKGFNDRNYISVNAHEATHQWFGDLITGRHDGEQWLQESFATFYPGLVEGKLFTPDHKFWYFRNNMNGALDAGKANSLPVRHSAAGSSRHYPKGASVLYMLQHQLGRDNFRRSIQLYLKKYEYQTVETWDLQKAIVDATGINMDWFFDQWIHRGGEPQFTVSHKINATDLTLFVEQTQKQDQVVKSFRCPVDIAIYFADGEILRKKIEINKQNHQFTFAISKPVSFVLFDEGSFILKDVVYRKSTEEYFLQLEKSEFMLDRYDALIALKNSMISDSAFLTKRYNALKKAWEKETFFAIKAEIASQLLEFKQLTSIQIKSIASNSDKAVRMAFVQKAPLVPGTQPYFEKFLTDSSYEVMEAALVRMWNHPLFANRKNFMMDQIKGTDGHTHNIRVRYFELGSEIYDDMRPSMIGSLTAMAGPLYEFRTRTLAMQALQRKNFLNESFAHNLFEGATNFNSRLNTPAIGVLKAYMAQSDKKLELLKWVETYNGDNAAKIKIRRILN